MEIKPVNPKGNQPWIFIGRTVVETEAPIILVLTISHLPSFLPCFIQHCIALLELQGDQTSQSWRKSILSIHWNDWCWNWSSNTLATWCKEPTHWKRTWCWERLKAREGDNRGWHSWMASPIKWTWVCANSSRLWRTGKPGVLQSIGLIGSQSRTWLNNWTYTLRQKNEKTKV